MHRLIILSLIFMVFSAQASDNTDCHDPEALTGWQALLDKYPGDAV